MNKVFSVLVASSLALAPAFAATPAKSSSSDSMGTKMKNAALWGPRKVAAGTKAACEKTKKAFHHNK